MATTTLGVRMELTGVDQVKAELLKGALSVQAFGEQINKLKEGIAGVAAIGGLMEMSKAATESAVAMAQLERAVKGAGGVTVATSQIFREQAESLERITGVSEDAVMAIQRILLTEGASIEATQQLTPLVLDLAAALGMDATHAARMIGQSLQGNIITLGRLRIECGTTSDLINILSRNFGGQAEAAFKAQGGIGQLRVATEEYKRSAGAVINLSLQPFFGGLAKGLSAAAEDAKNFGSEWPKVAEQISSAGAVVGDVIGRNVKTLLTFGSVIAALTIAVPLFKRAITELTGAFVALEAACSPLAISLGVIGAAFVGWGIGSMIRDVEILGFKIDDLIRYHMLNLLASWELIKKSIGVTTNAEFERNVSGILSSVQQLFGSKGTDEPVKPKKDLSEPKNYTLKDLETDQKKIAYQIEYNRYLQETYELNSDGARKQIAVNGLLDDRVKLIKQASQLDSDALHVHGVIALDEELKRQLEHSKQLLAVDKERDELHRKTIEQSIQDFTVQTAAQEEAIKLRREAFQSSPFATENQKFEEKKQSLQQEAALIQTIIDKLKERQKLAPGDKEKQLYDAPIKQAQGQLNGVKSEQAKTKGEDPYSLSQNMHAAFTKITNEGRTVAKDLADIFSGTISTAISAVSRGITDVIMHTRTWGQALYQIGQTIMSTVINAIVEMFAKWIVGRAAAGLASMLWSAKEGAADVVAKTPGAVLASISSWGLAVAIGLAAMAAIVGATGGFEAGGYTGNGGRSEPAGMVHRREFVFPASSVQRIGVPALNALKDGRASQKSSGGNLSVIVHNNQQGAMEALRSAEGEKVMLQTIGRNAHQFRRG